MARREAQSVRLRTQIDRNSPLPYYVQLKEALAEALFVVRKPPTSALFLELAKTVSL